MDLNTILLVVLSGVGSAIVALAVWFRPKLDQMLSVNPTVEPRLQTLEKTIIQLTNSTTCLARIANAMHVATLTDRRLILVVEDSHIDCTLIDRCCSEIARKHHLRIQFCGSLQESMPHIPFSRVVVLDVILPDSSEEDIAAIVDAAPCPVIVHSGLDSPGNYPRAFAVLKKDPTCELLKIKLEQAILTLKR